MRFGVVLLLLSCLALVLGCDHAAPQSTLPTTSLKIGSKSYTLEIAAKEDDRNFGLMQRDAMPADHGMIFLFTADKVQNFWMKNTRLPLDIVYVNDAGKVVAVKTMKPYKLDSVSSDDPARFAIELNAGQRDASGIKKGDAVEIPATLRATQIDP